ncbi:MAG: UvrD-helicase domain-containing protein [Candidatus Dormibacteria bacterium]
MELNEQPVRNVLVIAPAGCGKTEALASRALAALKRGDVPSPKKILALTYSNKAKDNLASRLRDVVGAGWQQRIAVMNFHGLATRIIRAHGRLIGIPPDFLLPEDSWRRRRLKELGIGWQNRDDFDSTLRAAKRGLADDDEVMQRLHEWGQPEAIAFEERLREEGRLDYDDLIRQASRLLAISDVARLYQAHFGMVMVDEVQDLSLRQFEMVRGVGGDRVTYAGDPAQGIYFFAGAEPVKVFKRIRGLSPTVIEFNQSYRSAPAVLRAVNALAAEMGSMLLECAEPDKWPDEGQVILLERDDTDAEAEALLVIIQEILRDPVASVAVVGRRATRIDSLRDAAAVSGISFQDWNAPTHVPRVVELLKRNVQQATPGDGTPREQLARLEALCRGEVDDSDVETLDEIAGACDAMGELVEQGGTVEQAVATCRQTVAGDVAVGPGLHVLTGHKGKGQEFDWVIVLGLEDGQVPDFRSKTQEELEEELRVLHVMVSRARIGLVITCTAQSMTKYGWRARDPSRWLHCLREVATSEI